MPHPRVQAFFIGGLLLLLLPASMSYAQRFQPFGPLDFTQDWQPFAPAEISSYGGGIAPNTGFFFTYDRIHLWVEPAENSDAAGQTGPHHRNADRLRLHVEKQQWLDRRIHADQRTECVR